ncbi:flavin reductase family protein [Microbacterium sp. A93]|uniref:flavin reductase family protein n=1 Tax=Microbacterium sp. A93 TaxID=3450716 RepID=UPI003F43FF7B
MTKVETVKKQLAPETAAFRRVLGRFASGVALIDASSGIERHSMPVTSFAPVSLEPPLVLFSAWTTSQSWAGIKEIGAFSASFLATSQIDLSSGFARKSPHRYELTEWEDLPSGQRRPKDSVGWMDCEIQRVVEAGDHEICIGRVIDHGLGAEGLKPVIFYTGSYWTGMNLAERPREATDA